MPSNTTLTNARADLRGWLEDLTALKPWIDDPQNQHRKEFTEAFDVAFAKAKKAAADYIAAVNGLG